MEWVFFNVHDSLITKVFNLYEEQKCREAFFLQRKRIKLPAHIYTHQVHCNEMSFQTYLTIEFAKIVLHCLKLPLSPNTVYFQVNWRRFPSLYLYILSWEGFIQSELSVRLPTCRNLTANIKLWFNSELIAN